MPRGVQHDTAPPSVPLTSMAGGTQVRFPTGAANPETAELNKRLLLQMA